MTKRKLLLINKFYHDKGPGGGVGRYLVQEEEDLIKAGWEVIPFAMADEYARPSPYEKYFVKARDYSKPRYGLDAVSDAMSLIWNREAARNLEALIKETRPDVAHLHNIYHHLSPSILPVLKKHGIPVVMTLHDLRLLCPAIHMLRDGEICEECKGGQLHRAVMGKCVKESRVASGLAAVETFLQRSLRSYESTVSRFLCPSACYKQKYSEWGYPENRLEHLPNFVDLDFWHPSQIPALPQNSTKDSYIFFGRISREKGLRTLLDAQALWEKQYSENPQSSAPLKLRIAGSGPCSENLKAHVAHLELKTVEILGPLDISGLREALGRARFSVLTSEWYENGPMAALESLAAGIPLVGTNIGGIPEMIEHGNTGIIVPPRDPEGILAGLHEAVNLPLAAPDNARAWAEKNASRQKHMVRLEAIFNDLLD